MPGGGGETKSTQKVNTSTDMGPWKEQQPFLAQQFGEAQRLYGQGAPQYFPGSTVAPQNWAQAGGYLQAEDFGKSGIGENLTKAANATSLKTIQGGFLDPSTNPWLTKTFDAAADPVTRAYQTATAPGTSASFSGGGRYGSPSYRMAVENNERGLGNTLGNLGTSIYGGNYQMERDRQDRATSNVGNQVASNFVLPNMLMGAGAQKQAWDQTGLSDDVNRWNYNQNADWQNLMRYAQLVGGNYGQQGSGTEMRTGTQPNNSDPFSQILGGTMTAASMALPFFMPSDVRLKDDIKPIGKTNDGQNLYSYRYKGSAVPQIGLMAQEVERRNPDAVATHPSGFKMVDYALALHDSILMPTRR